MYKSWKDNKNYEWKKRNIGMEEGKMSMNYVRKYYRSGNCQRWTANCNTENVVL